MRERPNRRFPITYAVTLWVPMLLAGGYAVIWSLWSSDPAPYRPLLGVVGGVMVVAGVVNIVRAIAGRAKA